MNAMLSSGARIAGERAVGWNRQLRITPLTTRTYFRAKVLTGYLMAAIDACRALRRRPHRSASASRADEWVRMTGLILVGLLPFAALGIVFGHLLTPDSIGPVMGGATALFAILGGTWFPITGGTMTKIGEALPSYWLVQASHVALGGQGWTTHRLGRDRRLDGRRASSSRAGPTGATRGGSSARPAAYDVTDAVTDASSGSSQATACASAFGSADLSTISTSGPSGRKRGYEPIETFGQRTVAPSSRCTMSLSRVW